MKKIALIIIVLLFASHAFAANYYVKNGGSDKSDGLTDATAWATLDKVYATVVDGDAVYLDYFSSWADQLVNVGGPAANHITYSSYLANNVIYDTWQPRADSPSVLSSIPSVEIYSLANFNGNMYVGLFTNGASGVSRIYQWDGTNYTLFHQFGKGFNFQAVLGMAAYNGKLYAGNTGADGYAEGYIYQYDPAVQLTAPYLGFNCAAHSKVTIRNDNNNNAIYRATSFSIEWLGYIGGTTYLSFGASSIGRIVDKTPSSTILNKGYEIQTRDNNVIRFRIVEGGNSKFTTTNNNAFTLGQPVHIVCSWARGSAPKIYINGTEASYSAQATVTTPTDDTADTLQIGNTSNGAGAFYGGMKRLRIYRNHALTSSEVTILYNGGTVGGATAEYLFDDDTGTTLTDSSGYGNNGTIDTQTFWDTSLWSRSFTPSGIAYETIHGMQVYNGKLYAGTGYGTNHGDVLQFDGTTWTTSLHSATGHAGAVGYFTVLGNALYAAFGDNINGIIYSFDGKAWTNIYSGAGQGSTVIYAYNAKIYRGIDSARGAGLYSSADGKKWALEHTFTENNIFTMQSYKGKLYIGTGSGAGKCNVYVYDGNSYTKVMGAPEQEVFILNEYNGILYAGVGYYANCAKIYSLAIAGTNPVEISPNDKP